MSQTVGKVIFSHAWIERKFDKQYFWTKLRVDAGIFMEMIGDREMLYEQKPFEITGRSTNQ